jgi:predicted nucleic acid-binding protein
MLRLSSARVEDLYPMMIVDASVVVEVLLQTERGIHIEERLFAPGATLHVPHVMDIEVAHAMRKAWLQGLIEERRVAEALDDLVA